MDLHISQRSSDRRPSSSNLSCYASLLRGIGAAAAAWPMVLFNSLVRRIKVRPTPVKEAPRLGIFTNTSTSASASLRRWNGLLASRRPKAHASRSSSGATVQSVGQGRVAPRWSSRVFVFLCRRQRAIGARFVYLLSFLVKAEATKQPSSTEPFHALKAALATFHSLTIPRSVSKIYNNVTNLSPGQLGSTNRKLWSA